MTINSLYLDGNPRQQGQVMIEGLQKGERLFQTRQHNAIIGTELTSIPALYPELVELINQSYRPMIGNVPGTKSDSIIGTRTKAIVNLLSDITNTSLRMYCIVALTKSKNLDLIIADHTSIKAELDAFKTQDEKASALYQKLEIAKDKPAVGRFTSKTTAVAGKVGGATPAGGTPGS